MTTTIQNHTDNQGLVNMIDWIEVLRRSAEGNPAPPRRDERSPDEWRQVLTEEQFRVTRQAGTERAFSSQMCSLFTPGLYACVGCGTRLFDARQKFESGTGWPSFSQPVRDNVVDYLADRSHGMTRIEARCSVCDAHLGHVFPDGPSPSRLRYCINAVALDKEEA